MEVYIVQHAHSYKEDSESVKFIGGYSSKDAAQKAIKRLCRLPGFCGNPNGFNITKYELDKDHWMEGYVPLEEFKNKLNILAKKFEEIPGVTDAVAEVRLLKPKEIINNIKYNSEVIFRLKINGEPYDTEHYKKEVNHFPMTTDGLKYAEHMVGEYFKNLVKKVNKES